MAEVVPHDASFLLPFSNRGDDRNDHRVHCVEVQDQVLAQEAVGDCGGGDGEVADVPSAVEEVGWALGKRSNAGGNHRWRIYLWTGQVGEFPPLLSRRNQ